MSTVPAATAAASIAAAAESSHGADVAPQTMRAVVTRRYGGPEVLEVETVPVPTPGPKQVLLEVDGAALDRGTWHLMTGLPHAVRVGFGLRRPRQPVPGLDVTGRVVAVGSKVSRFSPGDRVLGIGAGTFAEFCVADEKKLSLCPEGLAIETAAALSISGGTALQAVVDHGRVASGQRVLVIGASGGVGSFAVQIAVAEGAVVTGVASASKHDLVRDLGAVDVVDHRTQEVTELDERYDLVIDLAGNRSLRSLRRILEPNGTLVIVGGEQGGRVLGGIERNLRALLWSPFIGQRLTAMMASEHHDVIDRLVPMAASGAVAPAVDSVVDLDGVRDAMQRLVDGEVRGKVVVRP